MNMRDLIPWGRNNGGSMTSYANEPSPFLTLHREMNRLFDEAFRGFDAPFLGGMQTWPKIEIAEREGEVRIAAELPGMEEKDVEVMFSNGALIIRGERKSETEDHDWRFSERFVGRFERRIPIDAEVEEEKIGATFNNGVLTVTVPFAEGAKAAAKRIPINRATH